MSVENALKSWFAAFAAFLSAAFCACAENSAPQNGGTENGVARRRPAVFVQCQLKYGAQRDDFLHRWYERPLHQDSSFADADSGKAGLLNLPAWRKTVETLRLGKIDGVAYFASSSRGERDAVLEKSLVKGAETKIAFILHNRIMKSGDHEVAGKALKVPNYYRIDGKLLLLAGYGDVQPDPAGIEKYKKLLIDKYGDKFIMLSFCQMFLKDEMRDIKSKMRADGRVVQAPVQFEAAKERLRRILRVSDGIFYAGTEARVARRFDRALFEQTVAKVINDVMAEDEFHGKKRIGVNVRLGHENSYRWQYGVDSTGTQYLCDNYQAALMLNPDVIVCPEWDEENENTCFRPMVSHGYVHQRIMRYFADYASGTPLEPIPNDDVSVPNLVVSYRKSLAAGEPVEVEVRNIPDGTFRGETFEVGFEWRDAQGRTVKAYQPQKLSADRMESVWMRSPSAELVNLRMLVPRVTVKWPSGSRVFSEGMFPMDVHAMRCFNHKWFKHALREIPRQVEGSLEILGRDENGVYTVRGRAKSAKPMRSVEVLDDMDSAYVHSSEPEIPEGYERIRIAFTGLPKNTFETAGLNGTITIANAEGVRLSQPNSNYRKGKIETNGNAWVFKKRLCDVWGGVLHALVPQSEVGRATVEVDLPPHFKGSVKVSDLLKKDSYGFNGPYGCGLVVMRYFPTERLPRPLMAKETEFTFRWKPLSKTSVLRLQVIDADFGVWYAGPKTICRETGTKRRIHVYDRDAARTGEVEVDLGLLEDISCDFSGERGSVLQLGSGRAFSGMVGSSAQLPQAFGKGESHYGFGIEERVRDVKAFKKEGWGCLSLHTVPCFAGFALTMKVKPNGFGRRQGLYGSGNCGLSFYVEKDGTLGAELARGKSFWADGPIDTKITGPKLKDGEWNTVRLVTDRKTAWIEVDGVKGEARPYEDYFFNQRYAVFGAIHPAIEPFEGEIGGIAVEIL